MERIVTKIGDVTIERRVSKPQPSKMPLDSVGGNSQQHSALPKTAPSNKTEEAKGFPQSFKELPGFSKNIPKPPNINKTIQLGGNADFDPGILSIKQRGSDFPPSFPKAEARPQEAQKSENIMQYSQLNSRLEMKRSGSSLPKIPKTESSKQFPSNANETPSNVMNGPDLSKLIGISIERRKRVDGESHFQKSAFEELNPNSDLNTSTVPLKDTEKPEISLDDEEYEDSFEEEEFEGESVPLDAGNEEDDVDEEDDEDEEDVDDDEYNENTERNPHPDVLSEINVKKGVLDDNETVEQSEEGIKLEEEEEEEDIVKHIKEELTQIKEEIGEAVGVEEGCEKESVINDLECTDLVELMQKGEIEGEIEDVKDIEEDEEIESQGKKTSKRKAEDESEDSKKEDGSLKKKKRKKKTESKDEVVKEDEEEEEDEEDDEDSEDGKEKNIDKSKITNANLRKNIREVMDETKLDEATLAAQRQEAERLKRLQEQQRIIREVQRQIALNRQNQKSQNKVLSLLQGNSQTSILKSSSVSAQAQSNQAKSQNSVLVKLSNGEQTNLNNKKMIELLKNSKSKVELGKPPLAKTLLKQGMVTPSVTIAPIAKKETPEDDKKKKKDIVTISSDSEDDCIVLSDEDESEPEEDPTNSGMHTNDKYNLPDEKGRVVVNVGHPESETDLYLAPQIARIIKPHQIGGIRFLYDNVIESIERFESSAGFGCILAHSMGLGKTLQIVSFSDIFLRYTPAKTILCIMPINTIQNWLAEFNMWLPKESSSDDVRCRDFDLFIVNESLKNLNARARVILDWHKSGGVLLMGYELFRLLSLKKLNKSKKKKKDLEEENAKNKELIEEVFSALVLPGPDLVICDEGHRIKNSHATTSQALKQIRTKRRIVLTGYPLQNNLMEYWCMVDFVRPNYLGTKTEFSNMFERPIQNGQCIDSTPQDKRLMRYRAHVLHSLLEGFVQRRSHAVLQTALPEKEEYVLLLRFTAFQRKLYDTFMNEVVRTVAVPNPLKAFAVCCKIWNHPDVLYNFLKKKGEEIDLDLEEALPPSLQTSLNPYGQQSVGPDGMNQQGQMPWPKRGPGSRGGRVRQAGPRRVGRGRKPAATIPPSIGATQEKSDSLNVGHFPPGSGNFSSQQKGMDNFQGRSYNQNQFGFGSEFAGQPGGAYPNPNYGKNPLNNLENMSSGDFHSKNFFSQQNVSGNQGQYGNPRQSFDSGRLEANFNPNSSNDSNLNASFDSGLNSGDSNYKQNDFSPDFSSEFYSNNSFQNSGNSSSYQSENKSGFQGSSSYFPNPGFRNSENFHYQNAGNNLDSSFQNYEQSNSNFQSSRSDSNFQSNSGVNFQNSNRNDEFQDSNNNPRSAATRGSGFLNSPSENRFHNSNSAYQGSNSNFEGNRNGSFGGSSNFQEGGALMEDNYQGPNRSFQEPSSGANFQGGNFEREFWNQSNWGYPDGSKGNSDFRNAGGTGEFMPQKFSSFEDGQDVKGEEKPCASGNNSGAIYNKGNCDYSGFGKSETDSKFPDLEEVKVSKPKEDEEEKKEDLKSVDLQSKKEDPSLPYDWATDLFKSYVTGVIENSSKMEVFFHIVTESIKLGDRLLVFSQSLLTLDLIEDYLHRRNVPDREEMWAKNKNYFRLDGSTPGLEREKLINEFNANANIFLFLVSTRAGSLGINLVGANRVVVFDASWNPCHDTQAVCRVYRYGQRKPCFVYRLVMDSCLEKKIYDRQVNKQGMADRVVDELNPDAHLSIKEVTNLCWDDQEDTTIKDFSHLKDKYNDEIIKVLLERCSKLLSKEPFQHESLLIDRKEKKLSQAEKRLAKRSYELEKQAANQPKNLYSFFPNAGQRNFVKPIASVRPMQSEIGSRMNPQFQTRSKWIPAEVWQKQGMSAQEMTLPLDVVIPTSSPEKTSIVLKAGQRVMVLKSPKGIYMQLENGKIIAIRSAFKVGQNGPGAVGSMKNEEVKKDSSISITPTVKSNMGFTPKISSQPIRPGAMKQQSFMKPFTKVPDKKLPVNMTMARSRQVMGKAKPFMLNRKLETVSPEMKQRLMSGKMGFGHQEENFGGGPQSGASQDRPPASEDIRSNPEESSPSAELITEPGEKPFEEKQEEKGKMSDSLETLRKVTERISDSTKRKDFDGDVKYSQLNLKNYHNFSSQMKENSEESGTKKEEKSEVQEGSKDGNPTAQQQGNDNVQSWLKNQSYPPMDPFGNYFPGYYYGPGPGPMMPPYDGFYPPTNYGHPIGRNSPMAPNKHQSPDNSKGNPQPPPNAQNPSAPRNPPGMTTPAMYPPYPNPYPYPYNYPANPGFNNQGFSFPNQTQSGQQHPGQTSSQSSGPANPNQPYDSSVYSAFHRPDAPPFQNPENPYPTPYPRPPYPNTATPGFFPYNHPYPNYPYGHNFNPYMHPAGYGYPMQNPHPVSSQNHSGENNSSSSSSNVNTS